MATDSQNHGRLSRRHVSDRWPNGLSAGQQLCGYPGFG